MKDVVIFPAYFRPEFTYLSLENIYIADDQHEKEVRVYHDCKVGDDVRFKEEWEDIQTVLAYWKRGFGSKLRTILRSPNDSYGNSKNILEAYKQAYLESDVQFVHLIEDDIFITTDYFDWHRDIQSRGEFFATIAGETDRNPNPDNYGIKLPDGAKNAFFLSDQYASLGVCWKRQNLAWVMDHAIPSYYQNPTLHILKHFKTSSLGLTLIEQDGLIQRIAEQQFQQFAYSMPCRAFHVGMYGYHRGIGAENMFTGTLAERIEKTRAAVSDPEFFKKVANFQTDLQAFPNAKREPAFGSL